ncbi:MAG: hypothetical protein JWO82_2652 [Akkermansiaceae bacterium]|nr:hypothetical protein [Akkermansiaceae bacterium]
MPYSNISIVLNRRVINETETEIPKTLRRLFPGIVIVERDREESVDIVLDVLWLRVDNATQETYFESCGEEAILVFEGVLKAQCAPV